MKDKKVLEFPKKEQKGKELELEDKTYRLIEMKDSMTQTVDNLKKVIEDQKILIDILENSNESKRFKDFIKSVKDQISNYTGQISSINEKIQLITLVIDANKDPETSKNCSILLKVLGVFEK